MAAVKSHRITDIERYIDRWILLCNYLQKKKTDREDRGAKTRHVPLCRTQSALPTLLVTGQLNYKKKKALS